MCFYIVYESDKAIVPRRPAHPVKRSPTQSTLRTQKKPPAGNDLSQSSIVYLRMTMIAL